MERLLFLGIAILALNAFASARVVRSTDIPRARKAAQLALIWLLPVLGSIACLVFLRTDRLELAGGLDKTAFAENADAGGAPWDAPPGSGICGCGDSGGGDGGGGD